MALTLDTPDRGHVPVPGVTTMAAHRIRRCTHRRVALAARPRDHAYGVECLYPDPRSPLALGDMMAATAVCNACKVPTAFRDDED
jgi:hypothetical protein